MFMFMYMAVYVYVYGGRVVVEAVGDGGRSREG